MKSGRVNTYITPQLAHLLDEHGPDGGDDVNNLAEKLAYIVPAFDGILRDEKKRWTKLLSRDEWQAAQVAMWSHAWSMETGRAWELDARDCILANVRDVDAQELEAAGTCETDDVRASLTTKLQDATTAAQIALAWMLIRERIRAGQKQD